MGKDNRLPPFAALQAFERAAHLGSFTAAARELDSTQSAISQHVHRLEEIVGVPLFLRQHRGVRLSPAGKQLLAGVTEGLEILRQSIQALKKQTERSVINVGTDFAMAAYWLVPMLSRFRSVHPEIEVRLVTAQQPELPDEADIDISILFGNGRFGPSPCRRLLDEAVTPVCSPHLLDPDSGVAERCHLLSHLPLLQLEADNDAQWLDWHHVFSQLEVGSVPQEPVLTFNNYTLLLQAAIAGQGVALGWQPLCDALLESGVLIPVLEQKCQTECGYYLVLPALRPINAATQLFCDWLIEESKTR